MISVELVMRFLFGALAAAAAVTWLLLTSALTHVRSAVQGGRPGPDATPFEMLPTASQRIEALNVWASAQADEIRWTWDAQIARMFAFCAVLATLAAIGAGLWPTVIWALLGLASLYPIFAILQLRARQAQALDSIAARRDQLIRKIQTPERT